MKPNATVPGDQVAGIGQPARSPEEAVALPNGRAAWAAYALVMVILAASSVAPFVRFERFGPRLSVADAVDGVVYILTWLPFVALLAWYARRGRVLLGSAAAAWTGHAVLVLTLPMLHTAAFFTTIGLATGAPRPGAAVGSPAFQVLTLLGTLQYLVALAVLLAIASGQAAEQERVRAAELALVGARLETQLMLARVGALRAQLQPHFLFNTLNSISVLTTADPVGARTMIRRLSELLRAVLSDSDRPAVPLRREIELLNAYVAIQVVRFGDRLRVRVDVDPSAADRMVPTLVLQPLVENAIEYAIASREEGGSVAITARCTGEKLVLTVVDDGPGCAPAAGDVTREDDRGVGHRNTRDRLREMYGAAHAFVVEPAPGGGCAVRLELPG